MTLFGIIADALPLCAIFIYMPLANLYLKRHAN
jgi:hypothetical protein